MGSQIIAFFLGQHTHNLAKKKGGMHENFHLKMILDDSILICGSCTLLFWNKINTYWVPTIYPIPWLVFWLIQCNYSLHVLEGRYHWEHSHFKDEKYWCKRNLLKFTQLTSGRMGISTPTLIFILRHTEIPLFKMFVFWENFVAFLNSWIISVY